VLRDQLIVLQPRVRGRARATNNDRWFLVQMCIDGFLPSWPSFRLSDLKRRCGGIGRAFVANGVGNPTRPRIDRITRADPADEHGDLLWGAPRIHGELLKLGFSVAQSTVAKYIVKRRGPPSQGWRTFLRNHAPDIAAMDLFVVPTIGFKLLYGFVIVRIDRRDLVWINITTNPTAEWIAREITEAFPWDGVPGYMIPGTAIGSTAPLSHVDFDAMGIRDKPIAPASPWHNGFAERIIGSIRRECLDHIIVSGEEHLRRILISYAAYYNSVRTHPSLHKDAPIFRPIHRSETFVHSRSSAVSPLYANSLILHNRQMK
jgi:hypothetical protein